MVFCFVLIRIVNTVFDTTRGPREVGKHMLQKELQGMVQIIPRKQIKTATLIIY